MQCFCDAVLNGISGIVLAHLLDFIKGKAWFKSAKTEDLVKGLNAFIQKHYVINIVILTLIDFKVESKISHAILL